MWSYNKTQVSPFDPTKIAIPPIWRPEDDVVSKFGQILKKDCFF